MKYHYKISRTKNSKGEKVEYLQIWEGVNKGEGKLIAHIGSPNNLIEMLDEEKLLKQLDLLCNGFCQERTIKDSSTFWQNYVVPRMKKLHSNKCMICGSSKRLHIHHTDYSDKIDINTLKVLCASCHVKFHNICKKLKKL